MSKKKVVVERPSFPGGHGHLENIEARLRIIEEHLGLDGIVPADDTDSGGGPGEPDPKP